MKDKRYWQKRAEQVTGRQFEKTDEYISTIVQEYEKAMSSIEKDIESFYIRFSEDNEITMTEARRLLKTKELKEFNWTVEEYIKKGKENAIDQRWMKELENASTKVRVSRLEALQAQIQNQIETLTNSQQEGMKELLTDIYQDTYYRNIYEIHKGLGIETSFSKLDILSIEKVISQKWMEGNFSSRIWDNRSKLLTELQTTLAQSFIRGDSIYITASNLSKRMNVSKSRAITLVNTESAYITNKATIDSYKNSGVVKQYEVLSTLDNRTSQICRSMDGRVFKVSEMQPGINAPPFHPNCRTTTIACFSGAEDEARIAKDSKGQNYFVDGDITYKEWYGKYVKTNPVEILAEKKIKNRYSDKEQYKNYKEVLGKEIPNSFDKFQELKYNNSERWNDIKASYSHINRFNKMVEESSKLNIKGQVLKDINRINIDNFKFADFHINSERNHNITKEMAQSYINNAEVAYSRWKGEVVVYVSKEGCSVVNLKDKIVSTAYSSSEYDDKFKKIMELIKND